MVLVVSVAIVVAVVLPNVVIADVVAIVLALDEIKLDVVVLFVVEMVAASNSCSGSSVFFTNTSKSMPVEVLPTLPH